MNPLAIYLGGIAACGLYDGIVGAYNNYQFQKTCFTKIDFIVIFGKFIEGFFYGLCIGVLWPVFIWYL